MKHKKSREGLLSTSALRTLYLVIIRIIIALEISKETIVSPVHLSILLSCNVLKLVILDGIYVGNQTY